MAEHIVPKKIYFMVFGGLLCLTVLTTAVAYVDLGPWNVVVALAIAICKASLVATFFMHLRWSASMTRIVALAAIFWLSILVTLTLSDVFSRNWAGPVGGWQASAVASHSVAAATPAASSLPIR